MQLFILTLAFIWLAVAIFAFFNASDTRTYVVGWSALIIANIHLVGSHIISALGG
jgi:hypothetical protein